MMTRAEALEILGLSEKSLKTDIETRYAMLVKRYRAEQDNEKLEEISLAYNIITGRYVPPVEVPPEMNKVFFGKSRREWSNIWLYNKYKYLGMVAGIIFLVYMIYSVATNRPGDFKLAAVGQFYTQDSSVTSQYILDLFEDFKKVDISTAFLAPQEGPLYQDTAGEQKAMILITVSGEDVIVVDRRSFDRYSVMGAFVDLGELYEEIKNYKEIEELGLVPLYSFLKTDEDSLTPNSDSPSDSTSKKTIYGFDISDSQIFNALGLVGESQILTVSVKSKNPDLAMEFIRRFIKDSPNVLPQVTHIPAPEEVAG